MHDKKALIQKLKGAEDAIRLEVKNAFLNLEVSKKNIGTAEESLDQAKENYRITNLRYQQQMTTSTEVLDARTFLSQAETNYYGALYGYMISEAELDRAVGKGIPPISAKKQEKE
jgi:outer membrane protein TolC